MSDLTKKARALADGATPGRWIVDDRSRETLSLHSVYALGVGTETISTNVADHAFHADAAFIAASRELVPALVTEVERLERELDEAWEVTGVAGAVRGLGGTRLADVILSLRDERGQLRIEVEKWKRYKAAIDEALNSGDGTYQP